MTEQVADTHTRLLDLLRAERAEFRLLDHPAEGRSEHISKIRGNDPEQAMKALVLEVRGGGKGKRHVLAVIPGARHLDMKAVVRHFGAQKGRFAPEETARRLTGCVMGSVPPFSFDPDALAIVVDTAFQKQDEVCFNAGRLDRSLFVKFQDYRRIVQPTFCPISA